MSSLSIPFNIKQDRKLLLDWAQKFAFCFYSQPNNVEKYPHGGFKHILAVADEAIPFSQSNLFDQIENKINPEETLFGFLSYELQEETHKIVNPKKGDISWPLAGFFKAKILIRLSDDQLNISCEDPKSVANEINSLRELKSPIAKPSGLKLISNNTKENYISTVYKLKDHILEGDVYEINYCINYCSDKTRIDPLQTYFKLSEKSPTPFNVFLKWNEKYIICASPERFLKYDSPLLISQPIKGTSARSKDPVRDELNKQHLLNSEKERAENMMIVDLVRNDLSMSAETGSVIVEELFGVYSFEYVHQMISTISAKKKEHISGVQALKNAYPMGSMTGAPKKSALNLIKKYESHKRGVFSGSIGYFEGKDYFDFNVVIRSLFYDADSSILNYQIGSAITYDSDPEQEYLECQLKAQAIIDILSD